MKVKPKSCSCRACKAARKANGKDFRKVLQKRFRLSMKKSTKEVSHDGFDSKEANTALLSYYWHNKIR